MLSADSVGAGICFTVALKLGLDERHRQAELTQPLERLFARQPNLDVDVSLTVGPRVDFGALSA